MNRLNIGLNKDEINTFLLSARSLFQGIDRVQFFNSSGNLIGDTDILDLDQSVFSRTEQIFFDNIDNNQNNSPQQNTEVEENVIPEILELIAMTEMIHSRAMAPPMMRPPPPPPRQLAEDDDKPRNDESHEDIMKRMNRLS